MKLTTQQITLALALTGLAVGHADADIIVTPTFQDISATPAVSNDDLGQTAVADPVADIVAVSTDALDDGTRRLGLFNGAAGDGSPDTNEDDYLRVASGDTLTVNFDVSTNTLGYDITGITSVFNWDDRSDQGYSVAIEYVGGATATLLNAGFWGNQNPENSTQHYSIVTITNSGGGVLNSDNVTFDGSTGAGTGVDASGVQSITFTFNNLRNPSVAGEIDIFGTATVPEPGSLALLGLGGLLIARRRRN